MNKINTEIPDVRSVSIEELLKLTPAMRNAIERFKEGILNQKDAYAAHCSTS